MNLSFRPGVRPAAGNRRTGLSGVVRPNWVTPERQTEPDKNLTEGI